MTLMDGFSFAWVVTLFAGIVLAVARDVPILEVFADRRTRAGKIAALTVGGLGLVAAALHYWTGFTVHGIEPITLFGPVVIAYLWWTIAWRLRTTIAVFAAVLGVWPSPASAWNALGHRVVADVAWQNLDAESRQKVIDVLRRHPRYDEDFAQRAPTEEQERWIFQTAAVWPDMIRGNREFDMPVWHYVDFPLYVGPERPHSFPLGTEPEGDMAKWNVMQAVAFCRGVLEGDAPPRDKALAYCWIFHLVGDLHQPCHSTALICDKLPDGDKGGNSIPLATGRNLHSLWDGLLGRSDKPNDVKRAVYEFDQHPEWRKVNAESDVPAWVAESHELAKSFVYSPEILAAVAEPGELAPITLPESYLTAAGDHARRRALAVGGTVEGAKA